MMLWPKWVALIAGSTGSALSAVGPSNRYVTPGLRRDLVCALRAAGSLYRWFLAIIAQAISGRTDQSRLSRLAKRQAGPLHFRVVQSRNKQMLLHAFSKPRFRRHNNSRTSNDLHTIEETPEER
jgi:hypothetical protein